MVNYFRAAIDCYRALCDSMQYFLTSTGRAGCYVRKDKFDQRLASARSFAPRTPDPDKSVNLLGFWFSFAQFPALAPAGRNLVPGTLYATLPAGEAFRRAAEAPPGLRAPPPEGGVLRECLRRHGVVGTWTDLPALVP